MLRILTENKNKSNIEAEMIARGIDFTIYEAEGTWQGTREHSLIIEVEGHVRKTVFDVAEAIRKMNNQQAVYVQDIPTTLYEVSEEGRACLTL